MGRLLLILLLAVVIAVAIMGVVQALQPQASALGPKKETAVSDRIRTVSYVLLIALMFGITTGILGGL